MWHLTVQIPGLCQNCSSLQKIISLSLIHIFYMKDLPPALRNAAGECGHRAFLILSGILQETDYQAEAVSYESPYGIGHGVCAYYIREKDDPYVKIAKKALQTYVRTKEQEIPLYHLPREMEGTKGGVYVSLYVNGILRGSMGTVEATQDSLCLLYTSRCV